MQSKQAAFNAYLFATCAAVFALILAVWLRQGAAALVWTLLCGALLGFVAPWGGWRWALFLSVWIFIAVPTNRISEQPLCATLANTTHPSGWFLLVAPPLAVSAGVFADWIVTQGLRRLAFLRWSWLDFVKPAMRAGTIALAALIVFASGLELAQPLQPYGLGDTYCWDEFCFVVNSVKRTKTIGFGARTAVAHGTFYIVSAELESPWWGRFIWSNDAVSVTDYDGKDYGYSVPGQLASDRLAASSRSRCHLILGAQEHETIVFDLPDDVVQPRLLVRDTLGFEGFLGGIRSNLIYVKPAFNLRYD